ncbi:hypothetical protein CDL15_Pgr010859 [Punica granatum]|uniref:Fe2OG dioxygenase domain-containing protein n=1 Tax=Punica granatum TaxID=22663 RepID=A0A218W6R1_PUNGR|nr:hypothetical protein CDL15_Pgr010859 [Punica granatum]
MATPKVSTVKTLVEKPGLTHIPPTYAFQTRSASDQEIPSNEAAGEPEGPIPIVDFSLLTSGTPDQRSTIIQDLRNICQDWGCFMVINHGVDESLLNKILDGCREFFDLEDKEEKKEYEGKKILDTICYGTSTDGPPSEALFWRDYLRVRVHPEFHSPRKPAGFSEVLAAFSEGVRGVVRDLLGGISESLGLESSHIYRALDVESSLQLFVANFYPPCPQPELALGLPSHTDPGLLTLLMQNGINGLQLQRKGKWINANIISGAFFVQIDDHLEVTVNFSPLEMLVLLSSLLPWRLRLGF